VRPGIHPGRAINGLGAAAVVGGESMRRQIGDFNAGAQIMIAYPGRLRPSVLPLTVRTTWST